MTSINRKFEYLTKKKIRKTHKPRAKKAQKVEETGEPTLPSFVPGGMTQEQWNMLLELMRSRQPELQDPQSPYIPYSPSYPDHMPLIPPFRPSLTDPGYPTIDRIWIGDPPDNLRSSSGGHITVSGTGMSGIVQSPNSGIVSSGQMTVHNGLPEGLGFSSSHTIGLAGSPNPQDLNQNGVMYSCAVANNRNDIDISSLIMGQH